MLDTKLRIVIPSGNKVVEYYGWHLGQMTGGIVNFVCENTRSLNTQTVERKFRSGGGIHLK